MRKLGGLMLAVAAIAAGCGKGKAPAPAPLKTQVVDDKAGGFRIAIPEGWEREILPLSDAKRRWFAAKWKPANVAIPPEALFVHLMAPGCPASELGGKYAGMPFASEAKPVGFSIVSSGSGTVGNRGSFRIDGKYTCEKYGAIFEASMYVETASGTGYFITSRGAASDEDATKARLEAALGGFDTMAREIQPGKPGPHTGGINIGVPPGFDEFFGPSAFGTAVYALGAIDVQGRQESISMVLAPPVPGGEEFLRNMLGDVSKGFSKGEVRKIRVDGQPAEAGSFTPAEGAPPYEIALSFFRLGNVPAALCVSACRFPPGRALSLLEETAKTVTCTPPKPPSLAARTFGEGSFRASSAPDGWDIKTENFTLSATARENVPSPTGGEPKSRESILIVASLDEDYHGDGTPREMASQRAQIFDPKKTRVVGTEDLVLKDGRKAARLVVATPVSFEIYLFVRANPGALAQVHISALPALADGALALGMEMLAVTRYLPLGEQPAPAAAIIEASRRELPGLIQRGRGRAAAEWWYVEESGGKDFGGQHLTVGADGAWTDKERRPFSGATLESSMKGAPGTYQETVILDKGVKGPAPQPFATTLQSDTKIDEKGENEFEVWRMRPGGEARHERSPKPDLYLPADLSASDGLIVALAGSPEGTYVFASVAERTLAIRWKEYRVGAEEDIVVPAGKFKARKIEAGSKAAYWVAEGKVVKSDLGDFKRKLSAEADAKKYFAD